MASLHSNSADSSLPILWTHTLAAAPHGLSLAREKDWLLAWSENGNVYLLDQRGQRQAQREFSSSLTAGSAAEDGSAFAVAEQRGRVWWLAPDLSTRWEHTLAEKVMALALDPHGQYLAAAVRGGLHLFDRHGRLVSQGQCPRSLHYLAFVPEAPVILGSADYGLLACFNLQGACLWRDGFVSHAGSLAVSGNGESIVLACFTEGVRKYSREGKLSGKIPLTNGCTLAAIAYDGHELVVASQGNLVLRLTSEGIEIQSVHLERKITGLALSATGERAIVACQGGTIMALDFRADAAVTR